MGQRQLKRNFFIGLLAVSSIIFLSYFFDSFQQYVKNKTFQTENGKNGIFGGTEKQEYWKELNADKGTSGRKNNLKYGHVIPEEPKTRQHETGEPSESNSFYETLLSFDWSNYSLAVRNGNTLGIVAESDALRKLLSPFLEMEPQVAINATCFPPPLTPISKLSCRGRGNILNGTIRSTPPVKIGILIQFSIDVDVLEIYLHEVYDVVDYFFIIESTKSHFRTLTKDLTWERIKHQPRFRKFADKIVHFVMDDSDSASASAYYNKFTVNTGYAFVMEHLQEKLRWTKFKEWNEVNKFFSENDLIGFGDADEIPSRELLHTMRHCSLTAEAFDIGVWFIFGNIKYGFATDWPVPGYPYSLGDPSFWTLRSARVAQTPIGRSPTRMRGKLGKFLLGGVHMSHYGYLPFQLARKLNCAECSPFFPQEIRKITQWLKENNVREIEMFYGAVPEEFRNRIVEFSSIADQMKEVAILPWFYNCNRNRYPAWEGKHDTRLD